MIEGIRLSFTSDELLSHFVTQKAYHEQRVKLYQQRAEDLKKLIPIQDQDTGLSPSSDYSNFKSNLSQAQNSVKSHLNSVRFFGLALEHLPKNETFNLDTGDLATLELTRDRF